MSKLTRKQKRQLKKIIVAAVLFAAGIVTSVFEISYIPLLFFAAAYIVVGLEILIKAVKGLFSAQLLDENFLMAIATVGAFALGEFSEGVAVMLFYQVGELFQSIALSRSRRSITALMDLRADSADVERDGAVISVDPSEVEVGEVIVLKPGEKIPLDGVIIEGASSLNTAALTGESMPRAVSVGDDVLSGSVNGEGLIRVRTTKKFGESTVSKILDLVENSAAKKSRREAFITRFARWYTPIVVAAAVLISVLPPIFDGAWSKWVYQGLNFLVISCPCALVISVPLSFFGGIGAASKRGILIKGGNYLEALAELDTVIFDKTGTLTEGHFFVSEVCPIGVDRDELLKIAAKVESVSSHPIARSIVEAYGMVDTSDVTEVTELAGKGVMCKINGVTAAVGGVKLVESLGGDVSIKADGDTTVFVIFDGKLIGSISVCDRVKATAKKAVTLLGNVGIKRSVMLTGDNKTTAGRVASELGISEYRAELLPQDKVAEVERLLKEGSCAFVGDGINDAPVLSRADVGIAMGGIGSDVAIEAADVVLMDDDPSKIADGIKIARRTIRISRQNTVFALGVKGAIMLLGVFGIANMWLAVFADVGVSVLAILNAMRVQR
ncbi:MAG: cadmium-translocating P-type ATPase [Clostridia bacterium]|nr:cadmium-translocating P-type ATPase [Clostridia bacterium]